MNILMANWTWHPSGGDWTYIENLTALYRQNGHKIIPFAMKHERNIPNKYESYFIENIDYRALQQKNKLSAGTQVLSKSLYSFEAVKSLKKLLKEVKIDLAHINLIHRYLTPAILKVLKEAGVPIVWTLHDYTILCPESTFISNNQICEACKGGKFYHAVLKKCKKESLLASAMAGLENYLHHSLNYYEFVDYFICPSQFHYQKFKEFGFYPDRLHQVYHSFDHSKLPVLTPQSPASEKYILFVGRLEKIKGTHTLLESMKSCPEISLKIIGDGSQEVELKTFAAENKLTNVSFLGKMSKGEIWPIIQNAEFLICPSEWYEVLGFTIVEAMLMNKPVIGAQIGAIPETVIDHQTGLLFEAGNASMLADRIKYLFSKPELIKQLGKQAGEHVKTLTDPEQHYQSLKRIIPIL